MRYARGEAILRVIAMRYAPQLIVSQNEGGGSVLKVEMMDEIRRLTAVKIVAY